MTWATAKSVCNGTTDYLVVLLLFDMKMEWGSNYSVYALKLFSRSPRYDHFGNPPVSLFTLHPEIPLQEIGQTSKT